MKSVYIIYKASRSPDIISYSGATWDAANIRNMYQERYYSYMIAYECVKILNKFNPCAFKIMEIPECISLNTYVKK